MYLITSFIPYIFLLLQLCRSKFVAEEVTSAYYDLSISSIPMNADTWNQDTPSPGQTSISKDIVSIGNKHGKQYQCRVPSFEDIRIGDDTSDPSSTPTVTNNDIRAVLDPIWPNCQITPLDNMRWWTYEFCYRRDMSQYHVGTNHELEGEIISLGLFESEKDWTSQEALEELNEKRKDTLYHWHLYTNGTVCDLTGKPRQTQVRFYCDENAALLNAGTIESVDETQSCEYVMIIRTGALCRLPAFLPIDKKPSPVKIECQPVLNAIELETYMKAKQAEEVEQKQKMESEARERRLRMEEEKQRTTSVKQEQNQFHQPMGKEEKPVLDILGKSKKDYLKMTNDEQQPVKDERNKDESGKEKNIPKNTGGEETLEYEYMTHWLEQQLQELEMDEKFAAANKLVEKTEGLSSIEKSAISEVKRRNRRLSLLTTFLEQLETLTDDLFDNLLWYDKKLEKLGKEAKARAQEKIQYSLQMALSNLLDELDATEHDLEMLEEETDLSGLAAFKEMRERAEGRQRLLQELEDSGLSTSDFVKAKLQGGLGGNYQKIPTSTDSDKAAGKAVAAENGDGTSERVEMEMKKTGDSNKFGQQKKDLETESLQALAKKLTGLVQKLRDEQHTNDGRGKEEIDVEKKDNEPKVESSDKTESKADGGMKVRVRTIDGQPGENSDEEEDARTGELERRIAEKLNEAGFDTQGRQLQVKLVANLNMDDNADGSVHVLTEEEAEQFTNVVLNLLEGGSVEQHAEHRRYRSLENSYNFGAESDENSESTESKISNPVKTIVTGGRP